MTLTKRQDQAGFTLPELIVAMVMTVMFSGLIFYFTFEYWGSLGTLQNDSSTYVSRLTASDLLRNNINEASGLINQNSIEDAHTGNPDPAIASGTYWSPIHAVPGNIAAGSANSYTPVIYYRRPSVDNAKNVIFNGTQPYEDEYVLYMNGSKELRLRTLANTFAPGNHAKTSCPPAQATATCPADTLISDNIASVDTRYFSRSGNLINYQSITDSLTGEFIGPDFPAVEVVELNLHTFKKSTVKGYQDTINQTVIRVALRNG